MTIPDTTSAEGFDSYIGGRRLALSRGPAWRGVRASVYVALPSGTTRTPAVSEPLLQWTISGEVEVEEREDGGPWIRSLIKKDSLFLTSTSGPYECRWKTLSAEPFEYMMVLVGLPLLQCAFEEVFGTDAPRAQLRDVSGFYDETLSALMVQLRNELKKRKASALIVQGLAQVIAAHLAQNYAQVIERPHNGSPSLPGYKLRQITDWMAEHFVEDFNLDQLAALSGLSKFHFHRLFKSAVGVSPSSFHTNLRMEVARKLLRETKRSITDVSLEVGYSNSSYFAQVFRKEAGISPSNYRRQK